MEKNTVKLLHYHTQCVLTLKNISYLLSFQCRKGQAQNSFGCFSVLSRNDDEGFLGFLFSSSVESGRTVVVSENYLLLVAFVEF